MSAKGPPFNFFDILQQNGCSKNSKGLPSFTLFDTMRLTGDFKKIRFFFQFLSRAGALEQNTLTL